MATNGPDTVAEPKAAQPPPDAKSARSVSGPKAGSETPASQKRRRARKETQESSTVERFFLAEANGNSGVPTLGREMPSEPEAIVEAFRAGVSFFTLSEFRTRAETSSSRYPVIKKEAVKNSNHPS